MKLNNKQRSTWLETVSRGALLATVCAVGMGATSPRAARADAVSIAVVDEDKLADGFTKYQTAIKALSARSNSINDQLAARSLLNADEAKDFEALILKTTPTQADQGKIDGYVKTSNDRNAEYMGLVGAVTKSDADKARIKTLETLAQNNRNAVGELSDKLIANLKTQQDDTDKQFTDNAKKVIIKVANDRKFTIVVRSRGVIWNVASIDITDDVLKQLNQ